MRAVVLFSGGLDSAVTLYLAAQRHGVRNVMALSVRYGQRHEIELARAREIASGLGVVHMRVEMALRSVATSALGRASDDVAPTAEAAVVTGRNTFLLALAASEAYDHAAGEVWIGCSAGDAGAFVDCRAAYLAAMERALSLGIAPMTVVCPLIDRTKAQVVALARELGVPAARTWSCYAPVTRRPLAGPSREEPCGACYACRAREEATAEMLRGWPRSRRLRDDA